MERDIAPLRRRRNQRRREVDPYAKSTPSRLFDGATFDADGRTTISMVYVVLSLSRLLVIDFIDPLLAYLLGHTQTTVVCVSIGEAWP